MDISQYKKINPYTNSTSSAKIVKQNNGKIGVGVNLPETSGVYLFKKDRDILYIGKATSLKDRVRSYFSNDLIVTRGSFIVDMVYQADDIEFIKTDSVLEALILESNLIKKHQPRYNTKEKDDRSYNYVVITKEVFPRVLIERGRVLKSYDAKKLQVSFGPFTNGTQLKEALKIIRKIFPFIDKYSENSSQIKNQFDGARKTANGFYREIGLAPDLSSPEAVKVYKNNIKNIKLFFKGKKISIIKDLEKEMKVCAKNLDFEKADKIKRTIFALNHIQDVALIKEEKFEEKARINQGLFLRRSGAAGKGESLIYSATFRIEAYDVAHMSGKNTVGVMTVMENGTVNKTEYRKFRINESVQNDTAALGEILRRRFNHPEWKFPDIIVIDGSTAQKNIAEKALREKNINSIIVAVTKDERHKPKMITGREDIIHKYESEILLANSEAHRFAVKYHKELRNKTFIS